MKKLSRLLAALMLLSLVLTGCGNGGKPEDTDAPAAEKAITTSIYWDYADLDPATFAHKQPNAMVTGIFENLISYDQDMNLQSMLAESYDVLNDGLEYVFHLRKGVQFHKGYGEMKASDVVFTFQRMKDMGDASTAGNLMNVKNFEVTAEDDYTVKFALTDKDPAFLTHLALWCGFIVSEAAMNELGEEAQRNPVGTGPFEWVGGAFQEYTEMQKFADYWGTPAEVDRVTAYYITDSNTMYSGFDSGELNMINSENPIKTAEYRQRDDVTIIEGMSNQVIGFGLSTVNGPMADPRVREAIFCAIDIDDFIDNYLGGDQSKTHCMIPESCAYAVKDAFQVEYNVERAKQLLAEAGYPDGFSCELGTYNDDRASDAVVIQNYLAQIGIDVKVTPLEIAAFGERAEAGEFDIWYCGWSCSVLPDDFMVRGFRSDGIFNYGKVNDARYDELITSAVNALDEEERAKLYGEAQEYLASQFIYYPMFTLKRNIVVDKSISGYPFTTLSYPFNFQNLKMN